MTQPSVIERVALIHKHAFEHADQHMSPNRLAAVKGRLAVAEFAPMFSAGLETAIKWTQDNPERFTSMVADFDEALDLLNNPKREVDSAIFLNFAAYRRVATGLLPKIGDGTEHDAVQILFAARRSGIKLRLGETLGSSSPWSYFDFPAHVRSSEGLVAAYLTDFYDEYAHVLGLSEGEMSILSNAITEAAFLTNPEGGLFQAYSNPDDHWIEGYDAFSLRFQELARQYHHS